MEQKEINKLNITVILNQPYPNGMASTQRVHLYSKGMIDEGHRVNILLPIPHSYNTNLNNDTVTGSFEGVNYNYTSGTTTRSNNFLLRRIHDFWGLFNAGWQLFKRREETDAIILVSTVAFHILFFKAVSVISGAAYLTECNEYPFAFSSGKSLRSRVWFQNLYTNWIIPQFDGLIVISNNLLDFYKKKLGDRVKYTLVPVLVDVNEFDSLNVKRSNIVAYAGNLSNDKDGIYTQLRAFAAASKKIGGLEFYIIGNAQRPSTKNKAMELIRELGIEDKVKFTGFVTREELVRIFKSASALMLFKPDSIQAEYCFPSKIAEYLAAQTPVVTTSTGELQNYLVHRQSALLSSPDSQKEMTANLVEVLSNVELAKKISQNGYEIAKTHFDYHAQSREIISFILSIKNKDNQTILNQKKPKPVAT